jgi:hypothetical protein
VYSINSLRVALLVTAATLGLLACAPRPAPTLPEAPIRLDGDVGGVYPTATGAEWRYRRPAPGPSEARIRILGPRTFAGQQTVAYEFTVLLEAGLTRTRVFHRRVDPSGVLLLGQVGDEIANVSLTFEPAMQEYLLGAALRVGARWAGRTTLTQRVIAGVVQGAPLAVELEYEYSVLAQRRVTVPAGTFLAYVIEARANDAQGEEILQEIWFVPGLGEIRTREGFLLERFNFDFQQ